MASELDKVMFRVPDSRAANICCGLRAHLSSLSRIVLSVINGASDSSLLMNSITSLSEPLCGLRK